MRWRRVGLGRCAAPLPRSVWYVRQTSENRTLRALASSQAVTLLVDWSNAHLLLLRLGRRSAGVGLFFLLASRRRLSPGFAFELEVTYIVRRCCYSEGIISFLHLACGGSDVHCPGDRVVLERLSA